MPDDQRRNAERVPLDIPIEGRIGENSVRIVEISLVGCLLEHGERMSMGSAFTLNFRWAGEAIALKSRVARTELRMVDGKPAYLSGIHFADHVDDSPEPLQRVLRSLLPDSMPDIEHAAPSLFAANPFFRADDDEDDEIPRGRVETEVQTPPPGEAAEPSMEEPTFAEPALPEHDELDIDLDEDFDLPIEEAPAIERPTPFVECTLTEGVWTRRAVTEPTQPREGFTIVRPDNDREIDELCHTYLVADPDTRRLIRVSFDLVNAKYGTPASS